MLQEGISCTEGQRYETLHVVKEGYSCDSNTVREEINIIKARQDSEGKLQTCRSFGIHDNLHYMPQLNLIVMVSFKEF